MSALRRYRVGAALMVLAIIVGILVFYRLKDQQARAVQRPRGDTLVGVVAPVRKDLEVRFGTTADILANQQAAIFSKVSGYIRRIHVDRGDFVKEGQLLVEIDDQELQAQLQQARAGLLTGQASHQMARSTLDGNRANLENQRANLLKSRAVADNDARQSDRMKALFERGLVSATDWENARTTAEASRAQLQATEAQLRVAESQILTSESQVRLAEAQIETYQAALNLAQSNLANTRLVAPFAGYVSQRNLDAGAAVSAGSSGTNTSSLGILVVQDIKSVKVQVDVPERQIARVIPGVPVRLSVDPYTGHVFRGTVSRIVHALDPRARTMGVEVDIPNADGRLKPGMFARVDLVVDRRPGALAVPVEAVRLGDGRPSVVVVRGGAVEFIAVELGVTDGGWVEIVQGVGDKDSVIVQGKDLVKSGQKVKAVPATGI
ncbi:MAG TPA: efflux RND transporter periplasmic adaptor subunit [Methylomirabilota bacterium]|nr:efflux RND transporter periplasmic adaptor subunit [Methylomirabilota bacterium]